MLIGTPAPGRLFMSDRGPEVIREVVGIFQAAESLESAIDELLSSGFDRAEISLLASEQAVVDKLAHRYRRASDLMDADCIPRSMFVSSAAIGDAKGGLIGGLVYVGATLAGGMVVVAGGALVPVLIATIAAGGAAGLVGSLLAGRVGRQHAAYFDSQIEHGGLLLWVRAWTVHDEERAIRILAKHGAEKVHAHSFATQCDAA
jgi:hypothetical protein